MDDEAEGNGYRDVHIKTQGRCASGDIAKRHISTSLTRLRVAGDSQKSMYRKAVSLYRGRRFPSFDSRHSVSTLARM